MQRLLHGQGHFKDHVTGFIFKIEAVVGIRDFLSGSSNKSDFIHGELETGGKCRGAEDLNRAGNSFVTGDPVVGDPLSLGVNRIGGLETAILQLRSFDRKTLNRGKRGSTGELVFCAGAGTE